MKMLVTQEQFNSLKSRNDVPLECIKCKTTFYQKKHHIQVLIKRPDRSSSMEYCSNECSNISGRNRIKTICTHCKKEFERTPSQLKKSKLPFCSKPCSTFYYNTHKTTGNRRSKLEMWLEEQLTKLYPNLEIHFNKTNTITSELDIYIPKLKLAFELNGIFHYEPIYGKDKLKKTQNNDQRKFQACFERGISLCVIDTHNVKYLKKERDKKFLDIIVEIINGARCQNRTDASALRGPSATTITKRAN